MTEFLDDLGERALAELAALILLPVVRSFYYVLVRTGIATVEN